MKKLIIAIVVMLLGQLIVTAQDFQKPFETFTGKTPSYVYLEDGTELEGELIDLDRKKGLIKEVTIKDKTGKKNNPQARKNQIHVLATEWLIQISSGVRTYG